MSAPTPEPQATAPRVTVRLDSFDFAHPAEKQVQVHAVIPGVVATGYLLPFDRWEELRDVEWIDALNEAHDYYARAVWDCTVSQETKARLRAWLAVDEHLDELNVAWFNDRARRDPVSRSLLRHKEQLAARLAELEAERHTTNEALSDAAEALRAKGQRIAELETVIAGVDDLRIRAIDKNSELRTRIAELERLYAAAKVGGAS